MNTSSKCVANAPICSKEYIKSCHATTDGDVTEIADCQTLRQAESLSAWDSIDCRSDVTESLCEYERLSHVLLERMHCTPSLWDTDVELASPSSSMKLQP